MIVRLFSVWLGAAILLTGMPLMADSDAPAVQYIVETAASKIRLGQSPGVRLAVKNLSGGSIDHALRPSAFRLLFDGPDGKEAWFFEQHISRPRAFHLTPYEQMYLVGDIATYVSPAPEYFQKAGTYHLRYCDRWTVDGRNREICSSPVRVQITRG